MLLKLLQPITTGANSAMNQSEFLAIPCNLLEAKEKRSNKVRLILVLLMIGLRKLARDFRPITKRSNRNRVITFDSHLKTAQSDTKSNFVIL